MLILTKDISSISMLFEIHMNICDSVIMFIQNECSHQPIINDNLYYCSKDTIIKIKSIQYKGTKYDYLYDNENFEYNSAKFVRNVFNVINTIRNIALTYQNNLQTGVNLVAIEDIYKFSIYETTDAQTSVTMNSNENDRIFAINIQYEMTKRFKWLGANYLSSFLFNGNIDKSIYK